MVVSCWLLALAASRKREPYDLRRRTYQLCCDGEEFLYLFSRVTATELEEGFLVHA